MTRAASPEPPRSRMGPLPGLEDPLAVLREPPGLPVVPASPFPPPWLLPGLLALGALLAGVLTAGLFLRA